MPRMPPPVFTLLIFVVGVFPETVWGNPFAKFTHSWRDDPVWHDGKAEIAVYDATRVIYGAKRQYHARFYTNKEHADAQTKTKNAAGQGRRVFKHHLREDIPTKNYTYHFSTMVYVGVDDLKSLKLEIGSLEDCGSTFKQYINHAGKLEWRQSTYFPGEGYKNGVYTPSSNFIFHNALSVILRGYPFLSPPEKIEFDLLRDQISTRFSLPDELGRCVAVVQYRSQEILDLPYGKLDAYYLVLLLAPDWKEHYWFSADPSMLNVMVQYENSRGTRYKLRSYERRAYWQR